MAYEAVVASQTPASPRVLTEQEKSLCELYERTVGRGENPNKFLEEAYNDLQKQLRISSSSRRDGNLLRQDTIPPHDDASGSSVLPSSKNSHGTSIRTLRGRSFSEIRAASSLPPASRPPLPTKRVQFPSQSPTPSSGPPKSISPSQRVGGKPSTSLPPKQKRNRVPHVSNNTSPPGQRHNNNNGSLRSCVDSVTQSTSLDAQARSVRASADPVNKVVLSALVKLAREVDCIGLIFTELGHDVASLKALSEVVGTPLGSRRRRTPVNTKVRSRKQRVGNDVEDVNVDISKVLHSGLFTEPEALLPFLIEQVCDMVVYCLLSQFQNGSSFMYPSGSFEGIENFAPPVTAIPSEIFDSAPRGTTVPVTISGLAAVFFSRGNSDSTCKFDG